MTTATQADFARQIGVARSYVTALKKSGRLVLDGQGRVLVEESKASIARSNGAPERAAVTTPEFSDYREGKEYCEFELQKIRLSKERAALYEREKVLAAVTNSVTTLRSRLESLPDTMAATIAAMSDEQQVRAAMADQIEMLLSDLSAQFKELEKLA